VATALATKHKETGYIFLFNSSFLLLGIPKGRLSAMPLLQKFCSDLQTNGFLEAAAKRAGMQGVTFNESTSA